MLLKCYLTNNQCLVTVISKSKSRHIFSKQKTTTNFLFNKNKAIFDFEIEITMTKHQ